MNETFLEVVKTSNARLQSIYALIPVIKDGCHLGVHASNNHDGNFEIGYFLHVSSVFKSFQ